MECLIEGSTFPGNTKTVINNVNEIVTDKTFYVPGTNASSGKLSYFLWMNIYWCLQCKTALIIMVLHGLNLRSWSKHVYSYKVITCHFFMFSTRIYSIWQCISVSFAQGTFLSLDMIFLNKINKQIRRSNNKLRPKQSLSIRHKGFVNTQKLKRLDCILTKATCW